MWSRSLLRSTWFPWVMHSRRAQFCNFMRCQPFCECCSTQTAHGTHCNVSTSIEWLVVANFFGYLPLCFQTHANNTKANALLQVASIVNKSHEDFRVSVDIFDAQGIIHSGFDAELGTSMLCSGALFNNLRIAASSLLCSSAARISVFCMGQARGLGILSGLPWLEYPGDVGKSWTQAIGSRARHEA